MTTTKRGSSQRFCGAGAKNTFRIHRSLGQSIDNEITIRVDKEVGLNTHDNCRLSTSNVQPKMEQLVAQSQIYRTQVNSQKEVPIIVLFCSDRKRSECSDLKSQPLPKNFGLLFQGQDDLFGKSMGRTGGTSQ